MAAQHPVCKIKAIAKAKSKAKAKAKAKATDIAKAKAQAKALHSDGRCDDGSGFSFGLHTV